MNGKCQRKTTIKTSLFSKTEILGGRNNEPFQNAKLLQTAKISHKAEEVDKFKAEVIIAIGRFFNNDWGDVCESDKNTNAEAIKYYEMVVASYETSEGDIFIIAESDNGQCYDKLTICFSDEY